MPCAPLLSHNRTTDPTWQALYASYEPIITSLRCRGMVTDIELCGAAHSIHVDLPDGTYLTIGDGTEYGTLPSSINAVTDWLVTRDSDDNPTIHDIVYDSSEFGAHLANGALLVPLLVAIDTYLAARDLPSLDLPASHPAVITVTTVPEAGGARRAASGTYPNIDDALNDLNSLVSGMTSGGLTIAHQHTSQQWPQLVLARGDRAEFVRTTLAELLDTAPPAADACFCILAHPLTDEDKNAALKAAEAAPRPTMPAVSTSP